MDEENERYKHGKKSGLSKLSGMKESFLKDSTYVYQDGHMVKIERKNGEWDQESQKMI